MEKRFTWKAVLFIAIVMIIFDVCLVNRHLIYEAYLSLSDVEFKNEYGVFIGVTDEDEYDFDDYETIIIDAQYFTIEEITQLKKEGHIVYSYLNIGSLEEFRDYYDEYKGICLKEYDGWEGEYWVDITDSDWQFFITDKLSIELMRKGIDGFFVDNLDVYYEYKYESVYNAAVNILQKLKAESAGVIINGGDVFVREYEKKTGDLSSILNGVNQECVFTTLSGEKSDEDDREYFEEYLKGLSCDVYLLEYTDDDQLKKEIMTYCRNNGYNYYITEDVELK